MDWDSIRRHQELIDSFRYVEGVYMHQIPIDERQVKMWEEIMNHPLANIEIPAAAIQPFPSLQDFGGESALGFVHQHLSSLNVAIENARFLAELDYSGDEDEDALQDEEFARQAEERLVEVVPEEALDRLRRVRFAPLTLLNSVLRNPESMRALSARDFEVFIATLIEQLGFEDVVLTPQSGDEGRDILGLKRLHGMTILFAFECKRYAPDRPVGPDVARALLGTITHGATRANKGVLVTTSSLTPAARRFILTEPSLDGKDFDGVVGWLHEYASRHGVSG